MYTVEMEGVDVYDPVNNSVVDTGAAKVAAWFVDGDYDGRTFCITQAFFPDRSAWEKLSKALAGVVDPERFELFSGTVSLPFPAGKHKTWYMRRSRSSRLRNRSSGAPASCGGDEMGTRHPERARPRGPGSPDRVLFPRMPVFEWGQWEHWGHARQHWRNAFPLQLLPLGTVRLAAPAPETTHETGVEPVPTPAPIRYTTAASQPFPIRPPLLR
jgi:hypothetical protein